MKDSGEETKPAPDSPGAGWGRGDLFAPTENAPKAEVQQDFGFGELKNSQTRAGTRIPSRSPCCWSRSRTSTSVVSPKLRT